MKTIFLIVGGQIKQAQASIVGTRAEVNTEVGIREFGAWYESREEAERSRNKRKSRNAYTERDQERAMKMYDLEMSIVDGELVISQSARYSATSTVTMSFEQAVVVAGWIFDATTPQHDSGEAKS